MNWFPRSAVTRRFPEPRVVLLVFLTLLFSTPPLLTRAQTPRPEAVREEAKLIRVKESKSSWIEKGNRNWDGPVAKIPSDTWLIELHRGSKEGCDQWVEIKYTENLGEEIEGSVPGDTDTLYFCDRERGAYPFYNFRELLGRTALVKEGGRALFREIKDRYRPHLKSLRKDIESGRVQPQLRVAVAGDTVWADTVKVSEGGGIQVPMDTALSKLSGGQPTQFYWTGKQVFEESNPDHATVENQVPEQTGGADAPTEIESATSGSAFPWWALVLVGILTTLTGALGLFFYWERRAKKTLRTEKDDLEESLRELEGELEKAKEHKQERSEVLLEVSTLIEDIYEERDEENAQSTSGDSLSSQVSGSKKSEIGLLKEIKDRLHVVSNMRDLKEKVDQVQKSQENWKEEIRSLLREQLPATADQRTSTEDIESSREEIPETVDQRMDSQDIEELSRRIGEALFSHLKAASGEEDTKDKHLRVPIDKLEARAPYSPLPLKPGEEEAGSTGDRDQQEDGRGLAATSLQRSIDVKRMERLNRPKKDVGASEQEEQKEGPSPNTQTDAGTSVVAERSPEGKEEEPEQEDQKKAQRPDIQADLSDSASEGVEAGRTEQIEEESPLPSVDPDFESIDGECRSLPAEYGMEDEDKKKRIAKKIQVEISNVETNKVRDQLDAAKRCARIFSKVWKPFHPEKSKKVLKEVTKETRGEWSFHYSPGKISDKSYKEIKMMAKHEEKFNAKIAHEKIREYMNKEKFSDGKTRTIVPGIEWEGKEGVHSLQFSEIRYQADYSAFKGVHSELE